MFVLPSALLVVSLTIIPLLLGIAIAAPIGIGIAGRPSQTVRPPSR